MSVVRPELLAVGLCFAADAVLRLMASGGHGEHQARAGGGAVGLALLALYAGLALVHAAATFTRLGALLKAYVDWACVLLPAAAGVAVYEWFSLRFAACAPKLGGAYHGGALLVLSVPMLRCLRREKARGGADALGAAAAAALVFLLQIPTGGAGGYGAWCVIEGFPRGVALSFAVAVVYAFADLPHPMHADALQAGAVAGALHAAAAAARADVAPVLQLGHSAVYACLAAAVARAGRGPCGLLAVVLAAALGSAAAMVVMAPVLTVAMLVLPGALSFLAFALFLNDTKADQRRARPRGRWVDAAALCVYCGCLFIPLLHAEVSPGANDAAGRRFLAPATALPAVVKAPALQGVGEKPRNWRDDLSANRRELLKQLEGRVNMDRQVDEAVVPLLRDAAAEDRAPPARPWMAAAPDAPTDMLINGVIFFMDSDRKPLAKTLPTLQKHFLSCFPYPITVFKEEVTAEYKAGLRKLTTSKVFFQPIGHIFDSPPNNITKATATFWIEVRRFARGHHFGYRMMCRFFSGVFARYAFLKKYDFYWRLDTDSHIRKPVLVDPFRHMATQGCSYGYIGRFHHDASSTTVGLYDTVLEWAREYGVPARNVSRMHRHLLGRKGYARALYYNNFELANVHWITSDAYQSFFDYLDYGDGFMKSRWGDAPVRTTAVHMMLQDEEVCNFQELIDYKHGYWKNEAYNPDATGLRRPPVCPAERMDRDPSGAFYLPPRPP